MKAYLKYLLAVFFIILSLPRCMGQDAEMADVMRSEGKIYVVVSIIVVVLAGVLIYLVMMDRKVSRLERKVEGKD